MIPHEMSTYIVPLNCSQVQADTTTQQLAIFICRTSNSDQYRRVPSRGKCIDLSPTGWDFREAKSVTILVPDNTLMIELLPRGGLPTVFIESGLRTWYFEKLKAEPPQSSQLETSLFSGFDPESGTTEFRERLIHRPAAFICKPRETTQVQFQPHNLHTGIVVAFKRSSDPKACFYYCMEIGFDKDFEPTCILHLDLFTLQGSSGQGWWLLSYLFPSYYSFPLYEYFSTDAKRDEEVHFCEPAGARPSLNRSETWWPPTILPAEYSPRMLLGPLRPRKLPPASRLKADHVHGTLYRMFEISLPAYGCVRAKLQFYCVDGLEWRLVFQEEHAHANSIHDGWDCLRCTFVTVGILCRFVLTSVLYLSFFRVTMIILVFFFATSILMKQFDFRGQESLVVSALFTLLPWLNERFCEYLVAVVKRRSKSPKSGYEDNSPGVWQTIGPAHVKYRPEFM